MESTSESSAGDGYCGRYAPSPTGDLHLGNLRTALLAWLHARLHDGWFILRMDDLDRPRNRPGSAARILHDLSWLGIDWDEGPDIPGPHGPCIQSERTHHYQRAFEQLQGRRALYPCHCSRKDIARALSAPHGHGGAIYPGTCRPRSAARDGETLRGESAWRFMVDPQQTVEFMDGIHGPQRQRLAQETGDFVVRRKDGLFAYQLASIVDDVEMGITDVVRGDDLLDSTARQIALCLALGHTPPGFWHVPLMVDDNNERLSKRDGSDSLSMLRESGHKPQSVVGLLAASCSLVEPGRSLSSRELLQETSAGPFRQALASAIQNGQSASS